MFPVIEFLSISFKFISGKLSDTYCSDAVINDCIPAELICESITSLVACTLKVKTKQKKKLITITLTTHLK